ncbi:PKD domain-containing protein [Nocardiopsis rhodophaea]|uniref:PKD domain-containing protein n=2 Tax=Nocardiopsis rhodophaea TaxID=280238 RepID=UPI0031D79384
MRRIFAVLASAALVPVFAMAPAAAAPAPAESGPAQTYIVVLDDDANPREVAKRHGDRPNGIYKHALTGYAAEMTAAEARQLRSDPDVDIVQQDAVVHTTAQDTPTGISRVFAPDNENLKINGQEDFTADVDIAIIDTGIAEHSDLNIVSRTDCTTGTCRDGSGTDGHGHGTHVAGSAAAIDNGSGVVGVANGARLWSVKVLGDDGGGTLSAVTAGIDWVTGKASEIEVANMSLGCDGCYDQAMSQAISSSVDAGIVHTVAAGNSRKNAQSFFPANHDDVLTVSAMADSDGEPGGTGGPFSCRTDQDDTLADFSNYGTVVDITAPGVCIYSTWTGGGYNTIDGTSMAAPHVAGAAGLLAVGDSKPTNRADVMAIYETLKSTGNDGWDDTSNDGVKEPLLDVGDASTYPSDGGGGGDKPTAVIGHTCDDTSRTCEFDGTGSAAPDGEITGYAWDFGDGTTGEGAAPSHTYTADGTYTVTLTVTADSGATGTTSVEVKVGSEPGNEAPTAAFTATCYAYWDLCSFDASGASDPDGTIASYAWDFGDGTTGSGQSTWHFYNTGGTYEVTLTVTDDQGASGTTSKRITVG